MASMVVEQGTLVRCDVATREFILYLDEKEHFVLRRLDEQHLLIKASAAGRVQEAIDEHFERHIYDAAAAPR